MVSLPPILYFPILHNALGLPPRFCINYCCEILLGICTSPKSISQQLFMQNLGANIVHYGDLENRELGFLIVCVLFEIFAYLFTVSPISTTVLDTFDNS